MGKGRGKGRGDEGAKPLLDGGGEAADGFATAAADPVGTARNNPRLLVAALGVLLAAIGMVLIWCKRDENNATSTYAFMLVIVAIANLASVNQNSSIIYWVSTVFAVVVLDINVCYTDSIFRDDSDASHTLKAGYTMLTLGAFLTIVAAFPWNALDTSVPVIVGAIICIIIMIGNILLWTKKNTCEANVNGEASSSSITRTDISIDSIGTYTLKYPIFLGRAFYIATWHLASLLGSYAEGRSLAFILCCLHLCHYQPGGPRVGKASIQGPTGSIEQEGWKAGEAGNIMIFIGFWFMILHQLFMIERVQQSVPNVGQLLEGAGKLVLCCLILALAGSIFIWAAKDNDVHFSQEQEAWDVVSVLLCLILLILMRATGNPTWGVFGFALLFSCIDRILGPASGWPTHAFGTCPSEYSSHAAGIHVDARGKDDGAGVLRAGYIMLLIGVMVGSFFALPGFNAGVLAGGVGEKRDVACAVIIGCVAFMWCQPAYYGQLGLTAVMFLVAPKVGFEGGKYLAFVVALMQIPTMTPCTTCKGAGSIEILASWLCLIFLARDHAVSSGTAGGVQTAD